MAARDFVPPPEHLDELKARARALSGCSLAQLEQRFATRLSGPKLHRKGKVGSLLELALGALGGSLEGPDFPELGVELKTIPLDERGRVRESTFVCSLGPLAQADSYEWQGSLVQEKLSHVLWMPVVQTGAGEHLGDPLFWRPTPAQQAVLRADFDDIVGLIAIGQVERLTARVGVWLQARPKAAHGRVRTKAYGPDGEPVLAMPRGFYLRARFTAALLRDPATLIGAE
jgi:DNA mismatch repair protein MutH